MKQAGSFFVAGLFVFICLDPVTAGDIFTRGSFICQTARQLAFFVASNPCGRGGGVLVSAL
ncbi:hypothetical protein [Thalassospira sp.]|uniref:hypothetical protein n=1 Tax=Thalassospira sp. TaxID=1912094 RepID=UPI0025D29717|nr:hypothetical protein [Thalassospira sp.]|tara:strand:+ start:518 stop:700 length:183 start_codon:yes stop_codon:yes gene_type:complete